MSQETLSRREEDSSWMDAKTLICDICIEIMYNPVNISPCSHKFCCVCILKWSDQKNSCPKCRKHMDSTTKDVFVQQVIDQYLKRYPDRIRSEESRREADRMEKEHLEKIADEEDSSLTMSSFNSSMSDFEELESTESTFRRIEQNRRYLFEHSRVRLDLLETRERLRRQRTVIMDNIRRDIGAIPGILPLPAFPTINLPPIPRIPRMPAMVRMSTIPRVPTAASRRYNLRTRERTTRP